MVNGEMGAWLHGGGADHGFNDYGRGDLAPTLTKSFLLSRWMRDLHTRHLIKLRLRLRLGNEPITHGNEKSSSSPYYTLICPTGITNIGE